MSSSNSSRKRHRFTLQATFSTYEEKEAFERRFEAVCKLLQSVGAPALDNHGVLCALLDAVERNARPQDNFPGDERVETRSFLRNSGVYVSDEHQNDQALFVTEECCFSDLIEGLSSPCPCGLTIKPWAVESIKQKGHVLRVLFSCRRCHRQKRTWSSSRVLSGLYLANQKLVHGFTCAGVLPTQYINFSKFSGMGSVGHGYIRQVYNRRGYIGIVDRLAEQFMKKAVEEVETLPDYVTKGEWVITDARHDSTANAYHTTVPCLSGSTMKIVGISTISRSEHHVAQTRELECTKVVVPQVIARGLNIVEIAHDMQLAVGRYVKQDLKLLNSFDTWHGTKNVAKELAKITKGRVRDRDVTWFTELSDKRRSIKIHLYWAMKNCGGCSDALRKLILNIPNHYMGIHSDCHPSSSCHDHGYIPSRLDLTNPQACQALLKGLKDTYVYRYADDFCRCRDTYWVESFNHQLLTYLPKRIHFSTRVFNMRMNLAVMDWNENVNRTHTSVHKVKDLRRPDRRTPMKVLVEKTFKFVELVWTAYVDDNKPDIREIEDEETGDLDGVEDGTLLSEAESDDD